LLLLLLKQLYGVLQESVLGPLLFPLYTDELFDVISLDADSYGTCMRIADDTHVYISSPATDQLDAIECFTRCISRIREWMASNYLKMNEEKTQVIWLGTRRQLARIN